MRVRLESVGERALLTVSNSGRGIADDVGKNLFTPFYTTKSTGTGLGLVICKQIVEAHEGKIAFKSLVGKGTSFTVILPLSPVLSDDEGGSGRYLDRTAPHARVSDRTEKPRT